MADDLHYVPGDFYRICDRTGFKIRAKRTRKEWTGRIVRDESWEARHPQDFVTGVRDDQTVVDPRPRQVDVFLGPLITTLANSYHAGAATLVLVSNVRMLIGDRVNIMLDSGAMFPTNLSNVAGDLITVTINPVLPSPASAGNEVVDTSAVAVPFIG